MPPKVTPWATSFRPSNDAESKEGAGGVGVYERIDTSASARDGTNHLVHTHLCSLPGFVQGYDLYKRTSASNASPPSLDTSSGGTGTDEILLAVVRLGPNLAGYPETIHGGATALLFDDIVGFATEIAMAQQSHGSTERKAVTAFLSVDYLASLPLPSTVLVPVRIQARQGRKLWFVSQILNLDQSVVYAQAKVLYMLPRASL